MLLDVIEKNPSITQRRMSSLLNVSVSMINEYITKYEDQGLILRIYESKKTVSYEITSLGLKRKKLLNIWYLDASQHIYNSAKQNILMFLREIQAQGIKKILLYCAGEVAEIFLQVIRYEAIELEILGIIDDDVEKQDQALLEIPIISYEIGIQKPFDGILVSTYGFHEVIRQKLLDQNIEQSQILGFF